MSDNGLYWDSWTRVEYNEYDYVSNHFLRDVVNLVFDVKTGNCILGTNMGKSNSQGQEFQLLREKNV